MKPFDLEAAKKGAAVCTRDGRKARIICFDAQFGTRFAIVALVFNPELGEEMIETYSEKGRSYSGNETPHDLMMAPIKHEGWVRLDMTRNTPECLGVIYPTKDEALSNIRKGIAVARIEWEE